jgi:hypothetical protein
VIANGTYYLDCHSPLIHRREEMFRQNPGKHALWMMWHYSYMDSKSVFYNKACMTQEDIREACTEAGTEPSQNLRMVPWDPALPTSRANFAIVNIKARALVVKVWRHSKDKDVYRLVLGKEAVCCCSQPRASLSLPNRLSRVGSAQIFF